MSGPSRATLALAALVGCAMVGTSLPALAQTTVTTRESAATAKPVRLAVAPNLKGDCSTGPVPEVRVTAAPKNGSLITRTTKMKTPASYRCPNKEAEVQAVYYRSKAGFTGADETTFEIKTADGTVQRRTVQITVGATAGKESTDL